MEKKDARGVCNSSLGGARYPRGDRQKDKRGESEQWRWEVNGAGARRAARQTRNLSGTRMRDTECKWTINRSRPASTNGISPVTPVVLVYAACISGVSSHRSSVRCDSRFAGPTFV
ncbi:hypothetical protein QLX08_003093 [Tetragonisca angustula]|uniref:Uncharacterized protein n=1 Tax=Tetragonisca angustula TaxID=166442 RepID=A0AAW1A7J8_9HYME